MLLVIDLEIRAWQRKENGIFKLISRRRNSKCRFIICENDLVWVKVKNKISRKWINNNGKDRSTKPIVHRKEVLIVYPVRSVSRCISLVSRQCSSISWSQQARKDLYWKFVRAAWLFDNGSRRITNEIHKMSASTIRLQHCRSKTTWELICDFHSWSVHSNSIEIVTTNFLWSERTKFSICTSHMRHDITCINCSSTYRTCDLDYANVNGCTPILDARIENWENIIKKYASFKNEWTNTHTQRHTAQSLRVEK